MILPVDFDDDEGYRDFRPRMPKRQRVPPVVQLCKEMMPDIRTIGESVKAFEEDIKFLSEAIINEFGNEEYFRNALLKTLYAVAVEQPQKQPAIALLIMTVNSGNQVAGKHILNFFFEELQKWCNASVDETFEVNSNETGAWNKVKLLLRLLSLLSPMVIEDDLVVLYKKLFDFSIELNTLSAEKRNPLSEAIYSNILLDIPYLFFFQRSNESLKSKVEELISFMETNYKVKSTDISLTKEYNKNLPYEPVQWVQTVLPNVKNALANDMQQLNELFPDYQYLLTEQPGEQGFNDPLNLPTLEQVKPFSGLDRGLGSVDGIWKTPRYSFQVYLPNTIGDFETVVPITTYAGMLFDDIIVDLVESMEFNRKEVARQVVTLDLFFKPGIFTEPGQSIAQLVELHEESPNLSTFKIEDLAIENILSLIFKLPNVSQSFAYFYTLLVEICQNSPKAIAPVFGRAFRFFYKNLDSMDLELKMRYLDWFSIQMSNFNFSWKWNEWEEDSIKFGQSFYNPKITFVKNLIRKELRLTSNKPDVEDSLTEEFQQYLDGPYITNAELLNYYQSFFRDLNIAPEILKDNDLLFKQDFFPFHDSVDQLLEYFHKQPFERNVSELEAILEQLTTQHESVIADSNKLIVTLLVQVLVYSGNRSLSHANKYIGDSRNELSLILDKIEVDQDLKESWIIEAVIRYWNCNSQNGFLIVDTFKYNGLVSPKSILSFSFSEENGKILGLVDATSIESTFRNLTELSLRQETSVNTFEFVFEKLCSTINDTLAQLGAQDSNEVVAPILDSETMTDASQDLPTLELLWKYETAMGFIKSILRKYSDEYVVLLNKFRSGMDSAVSHKPTKDRLLQWFDEMSEL